MSDEMTVTVDHQALMNDLARLNAQVANMIGRVTLDTKKVVRRQMGLLMKTLMGITPPDDKNVTWEHIQRDVDTRFEAMRRPSLGFGKTTSWRYAKQKKASDIQWYAATPTGLYGVAGDADMRSASPGQLYLLYFNSTKAGKLRSGRRGKQQVYISRRVLTKASTRNELKRRLRGHIGRLKAAWGKAWIECGKPGGQVASWIAQHFTGARGDVNNGLDAPAGPEMTARNFGKGVGNLSKRESWLLRSAINIRINALLKRVLYLLDHPERRGEEEPDEVIT